MRSCTTNVAAVVRTRTQFGKRRGLDVRSKYLELHVETLYCAPTSCKALEIYPVFGTLDFV